MRAKLQKHKSISTIKKPDNVKVEAFLERSAPQTQKIQNIFNRKFIITKYPQVQEIRGFIQSIKEKKRPKSRAHAGEGDFMQGRILKKNKNEEIFESKKIKVILKKKLQGKQYRQKTSEKVLQNREDSSAILPNVNQRKLYTSQKKVSIKQKYQLSISKRVQSSLNTRKVPSNENVQNDINRWDSTKMMQNPQQYEIQELEDLYF